MVLVNYIELLSLGPGVRNDFFWNILKRPLNLIKYSF